MDRTRSLDRRYRRILYGGLAVSVGAHAALLGVSFDVPLLSDSTMEVARIAPDPFDAIEVVPMEAIAFEAPAGAVIEALAAGPVDAAPAAAPARSAASSPAASAPPVAAPVVAEVAFEQLTVFDPLSSAPIRPVEFTDLPVAIASLPVDSELDGEAGDDIEVYVPGSIGAAKRQWSGGTGTTALAGEGGARIFGGGGSGGHCPMPGGRIVPPIWK